jgi:signal transduction histidine kinase
VGGLLLALLMLSIRGLASDSTMSDAIVIARAEILLGDEGAAPPSDPAGWQPVALPDVWSDRRPGTTGHAWYRLVFDLPAAPQGRQAAYFARLRMVGKAFLNGHEIGQYGEFGSPNPDGHAQLFDFEPTLLNPGRNTLYVHVWAYPNSIGALSPVVVGPRPVLAALLAHENFLHVTVSWIAGAVAAVLGAMMLYIWLRRRHDTMFGWFAVAALAKALDIVIALRVIPGLDQTLSTIVLSGPIFAPLSIYCLRYAGWHWRRFETILWILSIGFGLNFAVLKIWHVSIPEPLISILFLGFFTAPLALALLIFYRLPGVEPLLLVLGHLVSLLLVTYSVVVAPFNGVEPELIHSLPVYLVMGWILTRRFVRSLDEARTLNAELASRVEAKRLELESNYRRMAQMEKEQAVVAERSRLMRDMHDGIGGQLISTLSLVESGDATREKVAAALRECIDDLRLAIDSLEPADDDLLPVLGNLRYRVEPRLNARGIALDWQVQDVPKLPYMTPQNVLHVLRILQEAFTNVLKHAGASRVSVATRCADGRVRIDVSDDGRGLAEAGGQMAGHGLANMRRRAQALGGELQVKGSTSGTTITLELPLLAAAGFS